MKPFDWDEEKNAILKIQRDVCFEDIITAIESGNFLDVTKNTNKKYPNQRVIVVNIENYAYVVPFAEDKKKYFLKTIFPSRKMTKKYLSGGK